MSLHHRHQILCLKNKIIFKWIAASYLSVTATVHYEKFEACGCVAKGMLFPLLTKVTCEQQLSG